MSTDTVNGDVGPQSTTGEDPGWGTIGLAVLFSIVLATGGTLPVTGQYRYASIAARARRHRPLLRHRIRRVPNRDELTDIPSFTHYPRILYL